MSSSKAGANFTKIYDTLPLEAQRKLLESYLVPLLDDLPDSLSIKVINTAKEMQTHFMGIPKLDYATKRTELEGLVDEIERDQKQSQYTKERSAREKLFEETIDSLSTWVNDIWSVTFEYQTNFRLAHRCLLLAADILRRAFSPFGGCSCAFVNLRFVTSIRRYKTGKIVKTFRLVGVSNFERVLLWTWRDLFVSMLASSPGQKHAIPDMLRDIQDALSWESLPKMMLDETSLAGGTFDDDSDDDLDFDMDDEDAEEESSSEDEDDSSHSWEEHPSLLYADHWPRSANFAVNDIRDFVQQCLSSHFQISPSLGLYKGIMSIGPDMVPIRRSLLEAAESNALWSSDNFAAALSIFAFEDSADTIWKLHSRGTHLLRPRDSTDYQRAVVTLAHKFTFKSRALDICQDQLLIVAREFRASLCLAFSRLYDPARVAELEALLKQTSVARGSNIESWVTGVLPPGASHANPMTFAAMMMGLPVPVAGGELGGADEFNMLDLEKDRDPDLEDLREEFRPQFKERFQSWLGATLTIGKHDQVFRAVFKELSTMMPFLRATDIVDEMLNRISDKPSRHHICDGLESLHAFVKAEVCNEQDKRKRKDARTKRKTTAKTEQASSSARGSRAPNPRSGNTAARSTNPGTSSAPVYPPPGGFDDLD